MLQEKSVDIKFVEKQSEECCKHKYFFDNIRTGGLRTLLTNFNIVSLVLMLIITCALFFCLYSFSQDSILEDNKSFRLTQIDGKQYVVVYQNDNQYFLEEAEVIEEEKETEVNTILVIYTNKQRIVNLDEISVSVYTFDDFSKKQKNDDYEKTRMTIYYVRDE